MWVRLRGRRGLAQRQELEPVRRGPQQAPRKNPQALVHRP